MTLCRIEDIFLFPSFWNLFPFHFNPLSHRQCDQNEKKKSAQKLMKLNKSLNSA